MTAQDVKLDRDAVLANCILEKETSRQDLWATYSELVLRQLDAKDPIVEVFLSAGSFSCAIGCPQFIVAIDPVAKHEEVLEGKIGTCLGATLWTEAYRHPCERVMAENEVMFNTANDQWIHLTIKADELKTKDTMTIEPTLEVNDFVLNKETRKVVYAFLKENPGYNIEDSGASLYTVIGRVCIDCLKDKDPVTEIILSSHVYNSFLGCDELMTSIEPVKRIRDMMEGKVGSLIGAMVYTEAYMHPVDQMMGPKEILFHTQSNKWFRVYSKADSSANV